MPFFKPVFFFNLINNFYQKQLNQATLFLQQEMGHSVNRASKEKIPINLSNEEVKMYINRFEIIDKDKKGYVSINDLRRSLKVINHT